MKPAEIRGMALREAEEKLSELKTALAKERAVIASGTKPEKPGNVRYIRRDIARFLTIMAQKRKAGEKSIPTAKEKKEDEKEKIPEKKQEAKEKKHEEKKAAEKKHAEKKPEAKKKHAEKPAKKKEPEKNKQAKKTKK